MKQAGFLVLRETSMPSCLIELGFISTPSDEQLLNDEKRIDDIARGIYQAFAQYTNKYDNSNTIPYKASDVEPLVNNANVNANVNDNFNANENISINPDANENHKVDDTPKVNDTPKANADAPIFKVQIFAADSKLKSSDKRFKGRTDTNHYKEGGLVKYTIGESTDYNAMNRLRRELNAQFPGCFVIAFKNGNKMNINEAIQEFKRN